MCKNTTASMRFAINRKTPNAYNSREREWSDDQMKTTRSACKRKTSINQKSTSDMKLMINLYGYGYGNEMNAVMGNYT